MNTDIYTHILNEARKGLGDTGKNPMVGAAIVRDDCILESAYHEEYGEPHAEQNLFEKINQIPSDSVLYCTLEPCLHRGKTGPCLELIQKSSLNNVVFGLKDPSSVVRGKSIESLQETGYDVEGPVDDGRYRWLNRSYFFNQFCNYPWIEAKSALSADGFITTRNGESKWITGKKSRDFGHRLRSRVDAVMVGAETVRQDDPKLTDRVTESSRQPGAIIVSREPENLPLNCHLFTERAEKSVLLIPSDTDFEASELLDRGVRVVSSATKNGWINWHQVLPRLLRMGFGRLLVEGGGVLIGSLMDFNAINEYHLFYSGRVFGEGQKSYELQNSKKNVNNTNNTKLLSTCTFGNDVYVRRYAPGILPDHLKLSNIVDRVDQTWIQAC